MTQPTVDDFYRQLHRGTAGDVDFYSRLVASTDDVLELGCGWGRLTRPLAAKCRSITGVDNNPVFCSAAAEFLEDYSHAKILQHDLCQPWRADGAAIKYDRVIAPYNLLYALGGAGGVASALSLVSKCLAADGEFWADVYPVDDMHAAFRAGEPPPDDDDEPVGELEWENVRYPILERSTLDLGQQRLDVEYRAVDPDNLQAVAICSTLRHDYLLLEQLETLFREAGLEISLLWGGFDGRPYDEEADQLVICAKHLSAP